MIRVSMKEGNKKPEFLFNSDKSSPIETVLMNPLFDGMRIIHSAEGVEAINGNLHYYAEVA